jgi:tetratricopeptide (TPR) repeat protein
MQQVQDIAALCQSGLAHLGVERLAEAERDFLQVTAQDPDNVPGLLALGVIAWQQQRNQAALGYARRVVTLAPKPAGSHLLLARVLRDMGYQRKAVASFRTALRRNPAENGARFELALMLTDLGELEDAVLCYRTSLRQDPAFAAGHYNLGNLLVRLGRPADAIPCYEAAQSLQPNDPRYQNNLADALRQIGRLTDAKRCYRNLLQHHPQMVEAHYNLGNILHKEERYADAATAFRKALELRPDYPDALNNLGATLTELGEHQEAELCVRQVVERQPSLPGPHNNLGTILRELGRAEEAEACFTTALQLAPGYSEARYNLATTLLLTGRLTEGWEHYETRWQTTALAPRPFRQPLWRGEALADRVLLLHAEQGMGDTLQFCRFVRRAATKARVILEVQRPLQRLLTRSLPEVSLVLSYGDPLPNFDLQCPLMSLPMVFGTTLETIPAEIPYLVPDPVEVDGWHARLATLPGLRVGLVWRGSQKFAGSQRKRDMDANHLARLADIPGVSFVSLQKDLTSEALTELAKILPMHDWTAELDDFAQTAALVAGLDLVIGVDTSVVHLAGALGRPVWLLNRFDPCWRWLRERDDSPWYPGLRQFRQTAIRDWPGVMRRVRCGLIEASSYGGQAPLSPSPGNLPP